MQRKLYQQNSAKKKNGRMQRWTETMNADNLKYESWEKYYWYKYSEVGEDIQVREMNLERWRNRSSQILAYMAAWTI